MNETHLNGVERFAASVLHDIRTPLSALSGEVDLAPRRERTPDEYRDILARIRDRVAELIDLTENLAVLGNLAGTREKAAHTSALASTLAEISQRFATTVETVVGDVPTFVVGDESIVTRAIALLLHHALRHRHRDSRVRLTVGGSGSSLLTGMAEFLIDAPPVGFWPGAWRHLSPRESDAAADAVPVRLRTAALIVLECGGTLSLVDAGGTEAVRLQLRQAALT